MDYVETVKGGASVAAEPFTQVFSVMGPFVGKTIVTLAINGAVHVLSPSVLWGPIMTVNYGEICPDNSTCAANEDLGSRL